MNREQTIDRYFEEMDLGPRFRLRDSRGAVSAEDEARLAAVKEATARQANPDQTAAATAIPPDRRPAHLQKKPADAALQERSPLLRPPPPARAGSPVPPADPVVTADLSQLDWSALEQTIHACRACGLCRQRRQAVPGVGDRQADWLFVGEGPGADEDVQGEPFVGQAGKLLDNMLLAIGLTRGNNVYIANAVKCRPPNNRTPEASEMAACKPYLERQIALLDPKLIVVLGRAAAHSVLGSDEPLGSLRGRLHYHGEIPVVVTYHPAYLLRTLHDKAKAWQDLCFARSTMRDMGGAGGLAG